MKATAIAPSNIAFIKFWGKKNESLRLPENTSISMNLSNLLTTTTVEFSPDYNHDEVIIDGLAQKKQTVRVIKHLDRIRESAKVFYKAKVVSRNNFPTATGLSSSASGFAALTLAASKASGANFSKKDLSATARMASGSACRSIPSGFVEWRKGYSHQSSYGVSIYPPSWWDIVDVVVLVSKKKKSVCTSQGHKLARTSPFFKTRLLKIKDKIKKIKRYIKTREFTKFGEIIEKEALEIHAIMITSNPPLIYWFAETLIIIKKVRDLRTAGLPVYFTLNTGQNVHLIIKKKDSQKLISKLKKIEIVKDIIVNQPVKGAHLINKHLF